MTLKKLNKLFWPILIVLISLLGIYIYEQGKSKSVQILERTEATSQVNKVVIQVDGAVRKPGIYKVTENYHLYELLLIVEPLPDADLQKFNLAEVLKDGKLYRIPSSRKEAKNTSSAKVEKQIGLVNINKASVSELTQIPGIGQSYAERIIAYREEKGYFSDKQDLLKVKGIGQAKFNAMEKYITLD